MADPPTSFFKFIPPDFKLNLSIPRSFWMSFNGGRRCKAVLRRGLREWPVDISEGGVFGDGWRKLVRENGVQELDFVVFEHQGNMVFDFLVFDQSMCERRYPNLFDKMDIEQPLTESDSIHAHNLGKKVIKNHIQVKKETSFTLNDHRYFISTLKPCSFIDSVLHLPIDFLRSNGLKIGKMILRDDRSRSWEVLLRKKDGRSFYLGRGFGAFRVANELKEGDAFKFELVKSEKDKPPVVNFSVLEGKPINSHKKAKFARNESSTPCQEDDRPYFVGELKSYSIIQSILNLPNKFAKENGLFKNGEMILRNVEDQRSWIVELKKMNHYSYLGRGWRDFRVANGLKEGDRFKLVIVENVGEKLIANFHFKKSVKANMAFLTSKSASVL